MLLFPHCIQSRKNGRLWRKKLPRKSRFNYRSAILFVYFVLSSVHIYDFRSQKVQSLCKMPGRISTRTSVSRISHKSSTQTLASRRSTTSPTVNIPEEGPESSLRTQICAICNDAQRTAAGHRKLVVSLRKIQESCCYEPTKPGKSQEGFDEDDFNVEIARCVIRLMGVKKSEGVGDRMIRFLGFFLRYASEKGTE